MSPTRSDEYPTLNVVPLCHGIVDQSSLEEGLPSVTFDDCVKAEQADRDAMIKEWSTFSSQDALHCRSDDGRLVELYGADNLPRNGTRCAKDTQRS